MYIENPKESLDKLLKLNKFSKGEGYKGNIPKSIGLRIAKIILKNDKVGALTLSNCKTTIKLQCGNGTRTNIDPWNRIGSPEINSHI